MAPFRLATRASPLALWQARDAARRLRSAWPGLIVELVPMTSSGDRDLVTPLYALGGVGVFAKEVQAAVLAGRADAGVHSCKDLPTREPDGLVLASLLPRADPRDALLGAASPAALPAGALVGTSSLRRQAQLAALRPDLRFAALRGNVQTRLAKLAAGEAAATLMAAAGLARLGLLRRSGAMRLCPWRECTPAPGQGAVAIDCRAGDHRAVRLLAALDHRPTRACVTLERRLLAALEGGCSLPLGCLAVRRAAGFRVRARLGTPAGLREAWAEGPAERCLDTLLRTLRPD